MFKTPAKRLPYSNGHSRLGLELCCKKQCKISTEMCPLTNLHIKPGPADRKKMIKDGVSINVSLNRVGSRSSHIKFCAENQGLILVRQLAVAQVKRRWFKI